MHMTMKAALAAWAKAAAEKLQLISSGIKAAEESLQMLRTDKAKLEAELAVYEAKKETL